jgi:WD40 repeat protein
VPFEIVGAAWNPYLNAEADEFVTICKTTYHYWRITKTLQL